MLWADQVHIAREIAYIPCSLKVTHPIQNYYSPTIHKWIVYKTKSMFIRLVKNRICFILRDIDIEKL